MKKQLLDQAISYYIQEKKIIDSEWNLLIERENMIFRRLLDRLKEIDESTIFERLQELYGDGLSAHVGDLNDSSL